MKGVFSKFLTIFKHLSTYLTIIVFFVYTAVLDRDLECTCKNQSLDCNLYMVLPFLISFVLHLWVEKRFKRIWRFTSTTCCCASKKKYRSTERCESVNKFILILFYEILKAAFIGLLWVICVLLDGDWYLCCWNDGSEQQAQLACKKENITAEEKANIAELKSRSKIIGLSVLFCSLFVFALFSSFGWRKCCELRGCSCNRKILYDELILEEEENVLKEVLREAAKHKLNQDIKNKIIGDDWKKCFDVAEELIIKNKTPILAKKKEEIEKKKQQAGTSRQQEERSPAPSPSEEQTPV
ncbi:uncharacterized protein LOC122981789 isoform X2 [Thunnus albacares]|uniref:uncharacterized protein LOC122981789 isoform X2 n=1 Tax=Thunnus albacares TaxID=8236 RepID=UPI001CF716FD|nr:uncharacterized protein LOC122981789 isoform X2 [Thunnus albacares]